MGRRITVGLSLSLCAACASTAARPSVAPPSPSASASPRPATVINPCSITDARITEASGIVVSSRHDGVYFIHNDSGDSARFFAIGPHCQTLGTYILQGVHAVDWEDIARGPDPNGTSVLWLADIGDNQSQRTSIAVQRVTEPDPPATPHDISLEATTFVLTYPDGPHDAETLLADPIDGSIYIVTKNLWGPSLIYAAPLPLTARSTLTKVNSIDVPWATGGDISADGSKLVIRNYTSAYVFSMPTTPNSRLSQSLGSAKRIALVPEPQGEAVAWTRDGTQLVTTSEGRDPALHVIKP